MLGRDKVTLTIFSLDGQRYALHLVSVERVVPMVAITLLPDAPEVVLGIITVEGRTIPALSLRRRFRLPERAPDLSDQFLIAHTGRRSVALWVDTVLGIVERPQQEIVSADAVLPKLGHIEGVITLADGVVLIQDLNQCLSLGEEQRLTEVMQDGASL